MRKNLSILRLLRDQGGAAMIESTIMLTILFIVLLGMVDFLYAFYQWNAASKAVQVGARIAAVSTPVATGLNGLATAVLGTATCPTTPAETCRTGDPMPSFTVTCNNNGGATCSCSGTCTGVSGYSASALNTIVYGRGRTACGTASGPYSIGMCNVFDRVTPANVRIDYTQPASGGIGFAGRGGGPAAIITVQLQNLPIQFFFLGGLMGFLNLNMPPFITTVNAEDLCSSGSGC